MLDLELYPLGATVSGLPASPVQVLLVMTALTVIPTLLMSLTPFLRITIVLHFLRQALGTQTAPSNQVLAGLALVVTFLVVGPVAEKIYREAAEPLLQEKITYQQAFDRFRQPARDYLVKFCREKDLTLFATARGIKSVKSVNDLPLEVVAPAYCLSELRAGFQIGAALYLPFLVIDLVVASLTLAAGMVQLPPVMISAPLKILLFVSVDGWHLLFGSLIRSLQ